LQLTATTAPFNETVSPLETTVELADVDSLDGTEVDEDDEEMVVVELVDVDSLDGTDVVEDDEEAVVVDVVSFGFGPSKAYSPSRR
jgi:hypothetical protein